VFEQLAELETELEKLEATLPEIYASGDQHAARDAGRRHQELRPIVDLYRRYRQAETELVDARELLATEGDNDMREYLRVEIADKEREVAQLDARLREQLIPHDPNDGRNVIVEIRGAEGGEEANLWAADLARMYEALARRHGWRVETLSTQPPSTPTTSRSTCTARAARAASR
jgi:peptide chain release factor 1